MSVSSDFSYNGFINEMQNFEIELNKFKTTYENYDTSTDSSFITLKNLKPDDFSLLETSSNVLSNSDCQAICSANSQCVAYSFLDGNCNTYDSSINSNLSYGNTNLNLIKNNVNIQKMGKYLFEQNKDILVIATNIKDNLHKYEITNDTDYHYKNDNDKLTLDASDNALHDSQKLKRELLVTNKTNNNSIVVKTEYFRYMFLFVLMFAMLTVFIYFTLDNQENSTSNFVLYLVLLVVIFSVLIIYYLQ